MKSDDEIKKQKLHKLSVPVLTGYLLIDYETILYLEADNAYTTFYLTDNSKFTSSKNLGSFEKELINEPFYRIHNSFIVNLTKVKEFVNSNDKGKVILINDHSIPVSRGKKGALLKLLR